MNASGEPAHVVQERLAESARAYGADSMTVTAFPTYRDGDDGQGEPATVELTAALAASPASTRSPSSTGCCARPSEVPFVLRMGSLRSTRSTSCAPRSGAVLRILGYAVLTVGVCLILRPSPGEVPAAAVFGVRRGLLRSIGRRQPTLQVLMPVIAAVSVSSSTRSAFDTTSSTRDCGDRGLTRRLPAGCGADYRGARTRGGRDDLRIEPTRVGCVQLALLAFGILAGIEAVGSPPRWCFLDRRHLLGPWAPWLGVLVFAVGVTVAYSAPPKSLRPVCRAVRRIQRSGAEQHLPRRLHLRGHRRSGDDGGVEVVTRSASAMPHTLFLPGFWLLVPGSLGLIGVTKLSVGGGRRGNRGDRWVDLRRRGAVCCAVHSW